MNSGLLHVDIIRQSLKSVKFAAFTIGTAKLYVEFNPWRSMTSILHKVLIYDPPLI